MKEAIEKNIIFDEYLDLLDLTSDGGGSLERALGRSTSWKLIAKSASEKIGREVTPGHCELVVVCYGEY